MSRDLIGPDVYVPTADDEPTKIEISDSEVISSGRDLEIMVRHDIMRGLDVPTRKKGKLDPIDEERWIVVCETLMQRGAKSIREIADYTGLTLDRAGRFIEEVRSRWANSLTMGQVNSRREQLYMECERVKEECWRQVALCENEAAKLAFMKMIIDAGKRQSALIGAERINVNVESKVEARHKSTDEMEAEVAKNLSISVEQFNVIGEMLSKQITDMRKDHDDG